jgi:hypothetical protein
MLFFGFALTRVGNFDDVQRLIKICGGLPPFSGVQSEDRVDCHVRDRSGMSVARFPVTHTPIIL